MGIGARANHLGPGRGGQRLYPVDMVVVMVGDEDIVQFPPPLAKCAQHGRGLGHVHDAGRVGGGVMHDIGIIVGKAGDDKQFNGHGVFRLGLYSDTASPKET